MKLRRSALGALLAIAGVVSVAAISHAATSSPTPTSLPIYQFAQSSCPSGNSLTWSASALPLIPSGSTMVGGPHSASSTLGAATSYRLASGDLALYLAPSSGAATWTDLSTGSNVPSPAGDPVPFFDPSGNVDILYVDSASQLELLVPSDPTSALDERLNNFSTNGKYTAIDLSSWTGTLAQGLASISVTSDSGLVTYRTSTNAIASLGLTWQDGSATPAFSGASALITPTSLSLTSALGTFASDPVVLPGSAPAFAVVTSTGALLSVSATSSALSSWTDTNLSTTLSLPALTAQVAVANLGTVAYVAATSTTQSVELVRGTVGGSWNATNVTQDVTQNQASYAATPSSFSVTPAVNGIPLMSGPLAISVTSSPLCSTNDGVSIAGQAADWGDLFVFSGSATATQHSIMGAETWSAADVSAAGGSSAKTVGAVVATSLVNNALTVAAAAEASPPPTGLGVYEIKESDYKTAVLDGWKVIGDTGGLGTTSAPWVDTTQTYDLSVGQQIFAAHKRATWLSFWTVSGPNASYPETTASWCQSNTPTSSGESASTKAEAIVYCDHGYLAGEAVATKIDTYASSGLGLKPDWVIFDPEGYPDLHSGLYPSLTGLNSSQTAAAYAIYANYWRADLAGWSAGLTAVDNTLKPGVYAAQQEYMNYNLGSLNIAVFIALGFYAFNVTAGSPTPPSVCPLSLNAQNTQYHCYPTPITNWAPQANIRGYIAFGAQCGSSAALTAAQKLDEQVMNAQPWTGGYNTLQFNWNAYCAPK
jgi:hypothetical protein